jgi:hypothetical protein
MLEIVDEVRFNLFARFSRVGEAVLNAAASRSYKKNSPSKKTTEVFP